MANEKMHEGLVEVPSLDEITSLLQEAVKADHQTVVATTQQALNRIAASRAAAAEAASLMNVARQITDGDG
jgi:hypothetical protein